MSETRDPHIESMLDRLGHEYRDEPDVGFEERIAHRAAAQTYRVPGRRRRLWVAPAVLGGLATAAAIILAVLPHTSHDSSQPPEQFSVADSTSIAEASFQLFDDTFGLSEEVDLALSTESSDDTDPTVFDDWFSEGDSL